MRNCSARLLATIFFTASLIVGNGSCGKTTADSLALTESYYADLMDASSVVAAIDSGLFTSYQGKDRAAWKQIQDEKYQEVAARLGRISEKGLPATDARALMLIHKGL